MILISKTLTGKVGQPANEDSKEALFIETIRDCFMFQHNNKNSRRRGDDAPSNLDLIFTNEAMHVSDVEHRSPQKLGE